MWKGVTNFASDKKVIFMKSRHLFPIIGAMIVVSLLSSCFQRKEETPSPLKGKAVLMADVPDETFASDVLGVGAAVDPTEGKVVAPADGEVSTLFDTHHAIGLTLDNGMEMLIHVGINTVELNGEGYEAHVSEGDKVVRGQTLITFDIPLIKSKGFPVITPVIITNPDDYTDIHKAADGDVGYLDKLIETAKQ